MMILAIPGSTPSPSVIGLRIGEIIAPAITVNVAEASITNNVGFL
jgi:hypothetical protein